MGASPQAFSAEFDNWPLILPQFVVREGIIPYFAELRGG
jgi:hypothetical protein